MAQLFSTGPALIYVGLPAQLAAYAQIYIQPARPPTILQTPPIAELAAVPELPQFAAAPPSDPHPIPPAVSQQVLQVLRGYTPFFLGTARIAPDIEIEPFYAEVFEDGAGMSVPIDLFYDGRQGWITADINRLNYSVYRAIASQVADAEFASIPFNVPAPDGIDLDGYIGTMMVTEGAALPLWVVFPYAGKRVYNAAGMVQGYRFGASIVVAEKVSSGTSQPQQVRLVWRCLRMRLSGGAYFLYDRNLNGLPLPN